MKALLKFSLATCDGRFSIFLYNEDNEYIWRIGGRYGDELDQLPRPQSLSQAKKDVYSTFPFSHFKTRASWL